MNRILITTICLLAFLSASAQKQLKTTHTAEHVTVEGTKISMIPPAGFLVSADFLGFGQESSSSGIMLFDIPGPFLEISVGLTKEGLLTQGVEVRSIEKMTLNGLPALWIEGKQNVSGNIYMKYLFVFGTEEETIMINGLFPEKMKKVGKEIKASMLSSVYEKDKNIDPFETVDFEINVSGSKLLFAKSMSKSLIFTADGLVPTEAEDKIFLVVAKSFSEIETTDKKAYAINRLEKIPGVEKVETTKAITIDGISGFEATAMGINTKTEETEKIYQVILFSGKHYYILLGTTNQDFEENIEELRRVVKTFKIK